VADLDQQGARKVAEEVGAIVSPSLSRTLESTSVRLHPLRRLRIHNFSIGGIDIIVNTAAIYPVPGADVDLTDAQWRKHSW